MLYNTPKSVIDAISKIVSEDRKKYNEDRDAIESKLQLEAMKKMKYEYIVPEDIEKEGVAHFMGAAAAAHKAGQKKFNFGGKVYPVQIKPHIAKQVNEKEVKEQVKPEVEKKFPASGVTKHVAPKPGSSTMPKDKEKRGPMPAGSMNKEDIGEARKLEGTYSNSKGHQTKVYKLSGPDNEGDPYHVKLFKDGKHHEPSDYFTNDKDDAHSTAKRIVKEEAKELDEISKKTLGSYISKASVDMANRTADGVQKRALAGADYAHSISRGMSVKQADANLKKNYDDAKPDTKRAVKRMHGIDRAVSRLTKEEVEEIDELSKDTLASYAKKAATDARFKQGIGKDAEALAKRKRDPGYKSTLNKIGLDYRMKAKSRVAGVHKAVDRLTKEEIEETKDTPGQSHQCALHVKSEQFGEGKTLFSQHAEPDEQGSIAWYDVMFEHGIEKHVPATELEILVSEAHMNHSKKRMKEDIDLEEGRGRPRKSTPSANKSDDEDDDYGPDTGPEPDQNIVNHLKKSIDTGGTHDVKFGDGSSHKVSSHVAHKVLGAMGKLKPLDRLEIQKHIHASHKNLMDVHRMIK